MPKDYLEAYKWFNLAAAKGDERTVDARINLASAERYLTPEQVAEAQRLAREFKPHKAPAPDESASPPAKAALASFRQRHGANQRGGYCDCASRGLQNRNCECEGGGRFLRDLC